MSGIEIIAHRGASFIAPENTVASSKLAWQLGADAVETDVWLSKDKKIMCIHDESTLRTTGQDLIVSKTNSATLRKLDAGSYKGEKFSGEKIPFLEELIAEVPDCKELVIEIKCGKEIIPYLQDVLENHGKRKRFSFIAFDFLTLREIKRAFMRIPCYWLCSNENLLNKNFYAVKLAKLQGFSLFYSIVSKEVVERSRDFGLDVFSWTIDSPFEAGRLISLGIRGIATNRIGWLNEQIKRPQLKVARQR